MAEVGKSNHRGRGLEDWNLKFEDAIRTTTWKNWNGYELARVYVGKNVVGRHGWLTKDKIKIGVNPAFPKTFSLERTGRDDPAGFRMWKSDSLKCCHFGFSHFPEFPRTRKLTAVKILEETPDCILCEIPE